MVLSILLLSGVPGAAGWLEFDDRGPSAPAPGADDKDEPDPCLVDACDLLEATTGLTLFWTPPPPQPMPDPAPEVIGRQEGKIVWSDEATRSQGHIYWSGISGQAQGVRPVAAPAPPAALAPAPEQEPAPAAAVAAFVAPATDRSGLAAGVGIGVGLLLFARLLGWTGLGLFSRMDDKEVLEHPKRRQIMDLLGQAPGSHFADLTRQTGLSHGVLTHHLRKLAEARRIVEVAGKGYTCYFVRGSLDRRVMLAVPLLKSDGARQVLQAIHDAPGLSVTEVSTRVEASMASVHHHLKRLHECGLVRKERDGRRVCHFPGLMVPDTLQHLGRAQVVGS